MMMMMMMMMKTNLPNPFITHANDTEEAVFIQVCVCVCVCQHDNTKTIHESWLLI